MHVYVFIFHKTKVLTVILRCSITISKFNWCNTYDKKPKNLSLVKDEYTYGEKVAKKGCKKVIFISKQSLRRKPKSPKVMSH